VTTDLSTQAAGQRQFIPGVWISTTSNADQIFVITQVSSPSTPFATTVDSGSPLTSAVVLAYQVDLEKRTALATGFGLDVPEVPGSTGPGPALLDVEPGAANSVALLVNGPGVTAPLLSPGEVILVPLPSAFDGSAAPYQSGGFLGSPTDTIGSGTLAAPGSLETLWAVTFEGEGGAGVSAGGTSSNDVALPRVTWLESAAMATKPYDLQGASLVDFGKTVLLFGRNPGDSSTTVFAAPDDFHDAGTKAPVKGTSGTGLVLAARPGEPDDSQALVLGVTVGNGAALGDASSTVWAGSVPASLGESLVIGSPPFTRGSLVSPADLPVEGTVHAWNQEDVALLGGPADGTGGLALLWLNPQGHVVGSGRVVSGPIKASAVQFAVRNGEVGATFYTAWIETTTSGEGGTYDRIHAAKVTCGSGAESTPSDAEAPALDAGGAEGESDAGEGGLEDGALPYAGIVGFTSSGDTYSFDSFFVPAADFSLPEPLALPLFVGNPPNFPICNYMPADSDAGDIVVTGDNAGTLQLSDNGHSLATIDASYGGPTTNPPTTSLIWLPGDTLSVTASGGDVDGFTGRIGAASAVDLVLPPSIPRSADWVLSWTAETASEPLGVEEWVDVVIDTGSGGALECTMPDSLGPETIYSSLWLTKLPATASATIQVTRYSVLQYESGNAYVYFVEGAQISGTSALE